MCTWACRWCGRRQGQCRCVCSTCPACSLPHGFCMCGPQGHGVTVSGGVFLEVEGIRARMEAEATAASEVPVRVAFGDVALLLIREALVARAERPRRRRRRR